MWLPAVGSWLSARPADWCWRGGGRGREAGLGAWRRRRRPLRRPAGWGGGGGAWGWCCASRRSGPQGWPRPVSTAAPPLRAQLGRSSVAASLPVACCGGAGCGLLPPGGVGSVGVLALAPALGGGDSGGALCPYGALGCVRAALSSPGR